MIMSFLEHHTEGVLTTIDEKGLPHASVINVHVKSDYDCYFIVKTNGFKYHNLRINDCVVFVCFDPYSRDEVQIEGRAHEVTDRQIIDEEKKRVEANITADNKHTPPYASILTDDFAVFNIKPTLMHTVTYIRKDNKVTSFHEKIEFED